MYKLLAKYFGYTRCNFCHKWTKEFISTYQLDCICKNCEEQLKKITFTKY